VLASLEAMGGRLPPTYVVGCRPANLSEGIGLSEPVAQAVGEAVVTVRRLVDEIVRGSDAEVPPAERVG
jgi:hydrogenase maturation protease